MKKSISLFLILAVVIIFFSQVFLHGLLPIPSDTLVGLYNPFRDVYAAQYPRGVPFKNFLITDPIRQQYPWRELAISLEKQFQPPLWNPYNFSGAPLLANFQSAAFYPLNIIFFFLPFSVAWTSLVISQSLLAGIFLYLYLRNLNLHPLASFLGGITFAFCGFSVAWLEWNTVVQTILWLPLILLSIDKIFQFTRNEFKINDLEFRNVIWLLIFTLSLSASFLAGHLQTFFYIFLVQILYLLASLFYVKNKRQIIILFSIFYLLFIIFTAIQWIPTLQFILDSARSIDQNYLTTPGWFVPWQHLIQFFAPDFFGNPTTLNYWGVWNYGELVGYIGIIPLIFVLFALVVCHDKKTYFFGILSLVALLFALPTPIAQLPFILHIPFLSTSQPTRLLGIVDFSFAILAALGFDYLLNQKIRVALFSVMSSIGIIFLGLWVFVLHFHQAGISLANLIVAKHNLLFPTAIFVACMSILILFTIFRKYIPQKVQLVIFSVLILIAVIDQLRFAEKFIPFTPQAYLYPKTTATSFLQQNLGNYRYMTTDSRILPPNTAIVYRLQTVEGYDPLYLQSYGELIAASERSKPDISTPFGFNRIITPHNTNSRIINLLGVRYILSLSDLQNPKLKKVFQEGETRIYENTAVLPRAFFVKQVTVENSKQNTINKLFDPKFDMQNNAVVMQLLASTIFTVGKSTMTTYQPNKVVITTENSGEGFLVLTDIMYPTWHATIDGKKTHIFTTDFAFRGVVVPAGKHTVVFTDSLF